MNMRISKYLTPLFMIFFIMQIVGSQIKLDKFITLIEMDFIVLDWYSQIIQ